MMTARSEYRLLLRQDNADIRLTPKGHEIGLVSDERYERFCEKLRLINAEIKRVEHTSVSPSCGVNDILAAKGETEIKTGAKLADLIRRPPINYDDLAAIDTERPKLPDDVCEQVNISIKYQGYIEKQMQQVEQFKKTENMKIPDIDYDEVYGLRLEARQKLKAIKPVSVGQASRISGVSSADIAVLMVYIKEFVKK